MNITLSQAAEISQSISKEKKEKQDQKIIDFLEEDCSLYDMKDFLYYADLTGKSINWIFENGNNINPTLKQAFFCGFEPDDLI